MSHFSWSNRLICNIICAHVHGVTIRKVYTCTRCNKLQFMSSKTVRSVSCRLWKFNMTVTASGQFRDLDLGKWGMMHQHPTSGFLLYRVFQIKFYVLTQHTTGTSLKVFVRFSFICTVDWKPGHIVIIWGERKNKIVTNTAGFHCTLHIIEWKQNNRTLWPY